MAESREGALVDHHASSIRRQPAPIRCGDPVGDHGVHMQLGVETTGRLLAKQPHHESFGVDTHDVAVTTGPGVSMFLDSPQHRLHRPFLRLDYLLAHRVVANGEETRNRPLGAEKVAS